MGTISTFERCALGASLLSLAVAFALVATGCKTVYLETVTPPGKVAPESAPPADDNRLPPPRSSREILPSPELKSPSAADSGRSTAYAESPPPAPTTRRHAAEALRRFGARLLTLRDARNCRPGFPNGLSAVARATHAA